MIDTGTPIHVGAKVHLFHAGQCVNGAPWGHVKDAQVLFRGVRYRVEDMPRVNEPCLAIVGDALCSEYDRCLRTMHGFSGSPWCFQWDGQLYQLVGSHVAKVVLLSPTNARIQASIAVPVERMLSRVRHASHVIFTDFASTPLSVGRPIGRMIDV